MLFPGGSRKEKTSSTRLLASSIRVSATMICRNELMCYQVFVSRRMDSKFTLAKISLLFLLFQQHTHTISMAKKNKNKDPPEFILCPSFEQEPHKKMTQVVEPKKAFVVVRDTAPEPESDDQNSSFLTRSKGTPSVVICCAMLCDALGVCLQKCFVFSLYFALLCVCVFSTLGFKSLVKWVRVSFGLIFGFQIHT